MGADTKPLEDPKSERKATEIVRIWKHGQEGLGERCYRSSRPVYTPPQKAPDECRSCDNNEWISQGKAERIKGSKDIIRKMP